MRSPHGLPAEAFRLDRPNAADRAGVGCRQHRIGRPLPCSNATLKGTYLYNESGVLNGRPYAESGREVYDGQKATSFISPDGSRFVYTITAAPGSQPTALSGTETRVAP